MSCGPSIYRRGASSQNYRSVTVGGVEYPVIKIGNLFWTTQSLRYHTSQFRYPNNDAANESKMGLLYKYRIVQEEITPLLPTGWRIPDKKDIIDLISSGASQLEFIDTSIGGTNDTGFSAFFSGVINASNNVDLFGTAFKLWTTEYSYTSQLTPPVFVRNSSLNINISQIISDYAAIDSLDPISTALSVRICRDV